MQERLRLTRSLDAVAEERKLELHCGTDPLANSFRPLKTTKVHEDIPNET